ncbi:hypothetical protein [Caballeronia sp. NK8]|nr:hypothetical protein [Caballeronia sp. NK8]
MQNLNNFAQYLRTQNFGDEQAENQDEMRVDPAPGGMEHQQ